MELTGAIRALAHVEPARGPVAIYTDSTYVIRGIREWIWNWQRRGWKTAEGADVLNRDLWEELLQHVMRHGRKSVEWHYVRGHARLATSGAMRLPSRSLAGVSSSSTMARSCSIRWRSSTSRTTRPFPHDRRAHHALAAHARRLRPTRTSASLTGRPCVTAHGRNASGA
jgi:hypothetical protein